MDDYYISREDWDTIVELGIGEQKEDVVLKKIATATKSALTRKYNSRDHPIPFHKAQDLGKIPKKLPGGPAPDLEEAFDVSTALVDIHLPPTNRILPFTRWMTLSMMQMTTRRLSILTISS
jgi:replication factor C subunit 1